MCKVLSALFSWHSLLFVVIAIIAIVVLLILIKKHAVILTGAKELLASPSGLFSLLTLVAITLVTWHQPAVGSASLASFCAIIPAALGFFEHREAMAQIVPPVPIVPPAPPVPEPAPPPNPAKPVIGSKHAPIDVVVEIEKPKKSPKRKTKKKTKHK